MNEKHLKLWWDNSNIKLQQSCFQCYFHLFDFTVMYYHFYFSSNYSNPDTCKTVIHHNSPTQVVSPKARGGMKEGALVIEDAGGHFSRQWMCMGRKEGSLLDTEPFDAELCLNEGEKTALKYWEAAVGGSREGLMENRQIYKLRGWESLSMWFCLSIYLLISYLSISISLLCFTSLIHSHTNTYTDPQ